MYLAINVTGIKDTQTMLKQLDKVANLTFNHRVKKFVEEEIAFLKETIGSGRWSMRKNVSPEWQEFKEKAKNLYSDIPSLFRATENYVKSITQHYIISMIDNQDAYLAQIGIIPEKTDALPIHPAWPPQMDDAGQAKTEPQSLEELDEILKGQGMDIWDNFFIYLHRKIFTNFQNWVNHIVFKIALRYAKKNNADIF